MHMLESKVSDLLQEDPRRAAIFEKYAIDYCTCNHLTLAEVCQEKQLDPANLLRSLSEKADDKVDTFVSIQITALANDIVNRHHQYAREQGTWILSLLDKVCRVHGQRESRLTAIQAVFREMNQDLLLHMQKEEQVLFPICKELEQAQAEFEMHCCALENPIQVMQYDHDLASEQLKQLQSLSDQYTPPEWACNSMLALYQALKDYHSDLEVHMHLENNILFPAALRKEALLMGSADPFQEERPSSGFEGGLSAFRPKTE